jgi:hypothetical protein
VYTISDPIMKENPPGSIQVSLESEFCTAPVEPSEVKLEPETLAVPHYPLESTACEVLNGTNFTQTSRDAMVISPRHDDETLKILNLKKKQ